MATKVFITVITDTRLFLPPSLVSLTSIKSVVSTVPKPERDSKSNGGIHRIADPSQLSRLSLPGTLTICSFGSVTVLSAISCAVIPPAGTRSLPPDDSMVASPFAANPKRLPTVRCLRDRWSLKRRRL